MSEPPHGNPDHKQTSVTTETAETGTSFVQSHVSRDSSDSETANQEQGGVGEATTPANLTIEQIAAQVESQVNLERSTFPDPAITSLSSQEVLDCLHANEDGDARLYIRLNRGAYVYDTSLQQWFKFNGNHWEEDRLEEHFVAVQRVIDAYTDKAINQARAKIQAKAANQDAAGKKAEETEALLLRRIHDLHTVTRKKNVIYLARKGMKSLVITGDEWDRDRWLLGCRNGVIDLKTGEFRRGVADDMIRTVAPIKWIGLNTQAPHWEQFQQDIFSGNAAKVSFFHRLCGYTITSQCTEHILPIFWGRGRNGKSTVFEVINQVLGPLAGPVHPGLLSESSKFITGSSPAPHLLDLRDKRIVWLSETGRTTHLNDARVKLLTGGDTLKARGLYEKILIKFPQTHTIFILTNEKPNIHAGDYAMWKRILLIEFERSFVDDPKESNEAKRDPGLREKLLAESSGILAWLVRGCLAWQKEGLKPPEEVLAATDQYQKDQDIIGMFIEEECVKRQDMETKAGRLYQAYKHWCETSGLKPINGRDFGKEMAKQFKKDKRAAGNFYKGVGLRVDANYAATEQPDQDTGVVDYMGDADHVGDVGTMGQVDEASWLTF